MKVELNLSICLHYFCRSLLILYREQNNFRQHNVTGNKLKTDKKTWQHPDFKHNISLLQLGSLLIRRTTLVNVFKLTLMGRGLRRGISSQESDLERQVQKPH